MDHQDEYYDNMITMLELIWGEGYMAPGGSGNVEKMLNRIETTGKRIKTNRTISASGRHHSQTRAIPKVVSL